MENRGKNIQTLNNFDYGILQSDQRSIVQQRTEEIKERLKRSAQDIWEIGQKLFEVRSQLAYGNFDNWLKAEFGWSRRTAYNFIKVYEAFPERATVAQVSIAASALYQLSSPSTPEKVRNELIQRAKDGEKITCQDIRLALKSKKPALEVAGDHKTTSADNPRQHIVSVISQGKSTINPIKAAVEFHLPADESTKVLVESELHLGWHELGEQHFLFYGDTASNQFQKVLPQVTLAIAVTSNDWDHDWLIDKAENLILLQESLLQEKLIYTLIALLSQPGNIVLFPWLPDDNMIESACSLGRIVVAGDPILERCQRAIAKTKLTVKSISAPKKL
jgi:hypothetical protein